VQNDCKKKDYKNPAMEHMTSFLSDCCRKEPQTLSTVQIKGWG